MREGDLDGKPYARYWLPAMAPPQHQVAEALVRGPEAGELGFTPAAADCLLDAGYLALENGFTRLPTGQLFIAALTSMPGVHGRMFEWWMGWHTQEAQRYKLWHPRAHLDNGTAAMRGDDPGLSDREKYLTTHYVTEYIGDRLERINISFVDPSTFSSRLAEPGDDTTALVCGRVDLAAAPITIGYLLHQLRQVPGGAEMRSRFWLGQPLKRSDRTVRYRGFPGLPRLMQLRLSDSLARDMLVHCAMEMSHLAGFLPALYADYHASNPSPSRER
jgi:hypothetical protein